MDMLTGIASAGIGMSSSRILTEVNVALMGKVMDTAGQQGQAIVEMIEAIPPSTNKIDVYA